MINKFEAIGIFASICCMILALFLLRVESTPEALSDAVGDTQASAVVVAGGSDVVDTLEESFNEQGVLSSMVIDDVVLGSGSGAVEGDTVMVHYIGTLQNGQQFDNSRVNGQPFSFTLGEGRVIAGWEQGVIGMKVGGQRILVIPPELAYGNKNVGPIPANSTLVFAIELLEIN